MNHEINRMFQEIRGKCIRGSPGAYPDYCHRATLDILSLLNKMREEYADIENNVLNLRYLEGFIEMEDLEALS